MRKMRKPMVGAKLGPIRFDQVAEGFGARGCGSKTRGNFRRQSARDSGLIGPP